MLIQSERKNPFHVTLNKRPYHFTKNESGVLVCDIPKKEAEILLKNPRYSLVGDKKVEEVETPDRDVPYPDVLAWSNQKANAYAKDVLGINPKSVNDIAVLAEQAGITLTSTQPSAMIKEYVATVGVINDERPAE